MALRRVSVRRIGLALAGTVLAALTLPLFLPMGQRGDGATLCYPFLGPVERFDPNLSGPELTSVRAHEDAHVAQCRRDGAVWHYARRIVTGQRLISEAEAYCAEAAFGVASGGRARLEYARVHDELRERRWFHRFSNDDLAEVLASQCPQLAATAAREPSARRNFTTPP